MQYAFHVLAKPTGAVCNLDCAYCFFLSKERLYPESAFRMDDAVLEAYVRGTLSAHHDGECVLAWQGGEPTLMGLDFFERAVTCAEKHRRPGQRVTHTIQTNGTRLDDAWCAFFKRHNFLVGLSVDGPRAMHDAYRVSKGGAGSFDQVMRGWELLRAHEVEVNILCTVHAANAEWPVEVYEFFRDEVHAAFMQFIPIVERATVDSLPSVNRGWGRDDGRPLYVQNGSLVSDRSVRPAQFGRFLCAIFDEWVRRDIGTVFVQTFDIALGSWLGQHNLCIVSPVCGRSPALEHNGDLYSCDHYVEPDYLLGNILREPLAQLADSSRQRAFGQRKFASLPACCRNCKVLFACYGECPRNRFVDTPDGEPGLNYLCEGYKRFFAHVREPMTVMANLLRQGRSPREVMTLTPGEREALLAAEDVLPGAVEGEASVVEERYRGIGRNDRCPCGSGKKFKRCHYPAYKMITEKNAQRAAAVKAMKESAK